MNKNQRPVQHFSPEYLKQCQAVTPAQIVQFLEDFRLMFTKKNLNKGREHE